MELFLIEKVKRSIIQESRIGIHKIDAGPDLHLYINTSLLEKNRFPSSFILESFKNVAYLR